MQIGMKEASYIAGTPPAVFMDICIPPTRNGRYSTLNAQNMFVSQAIKLAICRKTVERKCWAVPCDLLTTGTFSKVTS